MHANCQHDKTSGVIGRYPTEYHVICYRCGAWLKIETQMQSPELQRCAKAD
jgi:hypothetical protein